MKPQQVLDYFRSAVNFSMLTGMSAPALYKWLKNDSIPMGSQSIIESKTDGKLKADIKDIVKKHSNTNKNQIKQYIEDISLSYEKLNEDYQYKLKCLSFKLRVWLKNNSFDDLDKEIKDNMKALLELTKEGEK